MSRRGVSRIGLRGKNVFGLAIMLGASALSYVLYGTYVGNPEATTLGKLANIAIIVAFFVCGASLLKRTDSKPSLSQHRSFKNRLRIHRDAVIPEIVSEAKKLGNGESLKIKFEGGISCETEACLRETLGSGFEVSYGNPCRKGSFSETDVALRRI